MKLSDEILWTVKYTDLHYWNASTLNNYTKKVSKNFSGLIFGKFIWMLVILVISINVSKYYGSVEYDLYQYVLSLNIIVGVIVFFADEKLVKKLFIKEAESCVSFDDNVFGGC